MRICLNLFNRINKIQSWIAECKPTHEIIGSGTQLEPISFEPIIENSLSNLRVGVHSRGS